MMFSLTHQTLPSAASPELLWLIGGVLVLVSLQLRRLRQGRRTAVPMPIRRQPSRASDLAASAADGLQVRRIA